jgi:hypothetical protein
MQEKKGSGEKLGQDCSMQFHGLSYSRTAVWSKTSPPTSLPRMGQSLFFKWTDSHIWPGIGQEWKISEALKKTTCEKMAFF